MLSNLKTLTITDVPTKPRTERADSLALFIQECAEEELSPLEDLAHRQNPHDIPQGDHCTAGSLRLQRLILEMTTLPESVTPPNSSHLHPPRRSHRSKRGSFTKSSTEDADSEMFMKASNSGFSFIGEDDGGLLVSEGRIDALVSYDEGMIFESGDLAGRVKRI